MPRVDSDLRETWDSVYRAEIDGKVVHYSREAKDTYIGNDPDGLIVALKEYGLEQDQRIALVGAGFGWVGERFVELGYEYVVTVDNSKWIQENKKLHAKGDVLDVDIHTSKGRSALGLFQWVISEDVLPILSDEEAIALSRAMRKLGEFTVHWLQALIPGGDQDARLNWKSGEDWKALVSPDLVVVRNEMNRVL